MFFKQNKDSYNHVFIINDCFQKNEYSSVWSEIKSNKRLINKRMFIWNWKLHNTLVWFCDNSNVQIDGKPKRFKRKFFESKQTLLILESYYVLLNTLFSNILVLCIFVSIMIVRIWMEFSLKRSVCWLPKMPS